MDGWTDRQTDKQAQNKQRGGMAKTKNGEQLGPTRVEHKLL